MGLDTKAWNLGGLVGLVAGCGSIIVPAGESSGGSEGEAPTSTDPQEGGDETPSSQEGVAPQCESDDDCGYGQECRDGVCEYAPYCSTCCGDECYDPDTGEYPECFEDVDCPDGDQCFWGMCVTGAELPQCDDVAFEVQPLPIPGGDFDTNLVFVRDGGGGADRLVLANYENIAVVPPDGTTLWHDAPTGSELPRPILVGEFDGDAGDEVMLSGFVDDVYGMAVYEIDSGAPELVAFTPSEVQNPVVGDFDGDGDDDVLTYVVGVGQSIYAAQGDGTFAPYVALDWYDAWVLPVDVEGDGRDEILTEFGTVMGVTDDVTLETRFEFAGMAPAVSIVSVLANDFDADGTRELLVARGWSETWLEHRDTTGALVSAFAVPEGGGYMRPAALGGASALDVALHAAVVLDPTGMACVLSYTDPGDTQRAAAGDWDGDGLGEIVVKHEFSYDFSLARLPAPR